VNINILLVRSITSTKPVSQSDLVVNQLFYLISLIPAEKRNSRDDKSGLPVWCVSASGVTLPQCLIFKGEDLNSSWIPDEMTKEFSSPGKWYKTCCRTSSRTLLFEE